MPTLIGTEVKRLEIPCSRRGWGRKAVFATFLTFTNTKPDKKQLEKGALSGLQPTTVGKAWWQELSQEAGRDEVNADVS